MASENTSGGASDGTLGRIALKQVRMTRAEVEARTRETSGARRAAAGNPRNRLVPYLDLFSRLGDEELSRLARAPLSAVEGLRQQIEEVNRAFGRYVDLLPRLSDDELARMTGAKAKTIRFWRLSQPRHLQGRRPSSAADSSPALVQPEAGEREREISASHSLGSVPTLAEAAADSAPMSAAVSSSGLSTKREPSDAYEAPKGPAESATMVMDVEFE
ncbi:hypothetical protein G6O69_10640 [Pseudenhygromyxa sp. WMMC2535]|uniref:hypothetical protein n=1 Tax=Pseudenhygromyxa sp. WMMC2535 TaxID=2712867 RepID=UPI0015523DF5|nr:hypothetical protein [Pseudenhygromyxa sp. WMMC2535]NVB38289.1 hypothetical protein [Pseudenhygromyxa sp. WMMC2535]